ncbi:ultraviolet-B receptor UVR8-like isoform X1 [Olea europaea var. sylvestris]|uniref:ultraviolet-B receptor UVR8-like isoform X1 n=1 Tax=Olea europaea var. sylvestris TaxID=158386 RepID=UPI000C1CDC75|nr:ultraviolet-B receptor UVR8-like isoform X1 [Olea europaea var. sylvestris]
MNGGEGIKDLEVNGNKEKKCEVLMWGYLPGASQLQSSLTSPVSVRFPEAEVSGDSWKDVCGGGCGFGLAISASGKLITWGSADDQGQSYLTSGKHEETPEPYPLPTNDPILKAAAGWAHCVSVTGKGEVYTWGWKECVPPGKVTCSWTSMKTFERNRSAKQSSTLTEQGSPQSQGPKPSVGSLSCSDDKNIEDESIKRRKVSTQEESEISIPAEETLSAPPCLVMLDPLVKITSVAAGGRHTLALSDVGQVWGWGYGGDGQLGLGNRVKTVASPHLIPCIDPSSCIKDKPDVVHQESESAAAQSHNSVGNYIRAVACGGRHSAVITDAGVLIAFGWGLYGQCGQGNREDLLRPTCVTSLSGTQIETVAAGLWHTICICKDGCVYAFGGNQFGQLGLGTNSDQCELIPKLLDASVMENKNAKVVSCGARHSVILTGKMLYQFGSDFGLPATFRDEGKIYSWGWNKYGQLGLGDTVDRNIPSQVPVDNYVPKNIGCGWWHTLSLCETVS